MISLIQHFEADFLWKVSLKILNSGIILKTFTHGLSSWILRPKEKYVLFPITSPSVGRQTLFFYKNFFCIVKSKNLLKRSKSRLQYPKRLPKSLSRPQNIRVGRVTGNETFSFFCLICLNWPCKHVLIVFAEIINQNFDIVHFIISP